MNKPDPAALPVQTDQGVTLIAAGPATGAMLRQALALAPVLVAADGGADRALRLGHRPVAVIGDLDSASAATLAALPSHRIPEQETTDVDKALRSVAAPFVIALGVLGGRVDHELAVFSTLLSQAHRPVLALGARDVVFAAPRRLRLALRAGDRLSIYPLRAVTGRSLGLDWPIDGLRLAPDGRIGTSNRVSRGEVALAFDGPGVLIVLPRARLPAALAALRPATLRPGR